MSYRLVYLATQENYLTKELLEIFINSTTDFINLLHIIKKRLCNTGYDYDIKELNNLLSQIYNYITNEKIKISKILDNLKPSTPTQVSNRNLIYLFNNENEAVKDLIHSLNEYQKTLAMFIAQLLYIFTECK